jgi:imidazolonepropionase
MSNKTLIGPFTQILTMDNLPVAGPLTDDLLEVVENGGVMIEDQHIVNILNENDFKNYLAGISKESSEVTYCEIENKSVLVPGLIDAHTHICYAGSRADDYARRLAGESYMDIAKKGGGILSTVVKTRAASEDMLAELLFKRAQIHLERGVTTCEVKSGYGLNRESELSMLRAIHTVANIKEPPVPDLIPTCLSAHVKPEEFEKHEEYLDYIVNDILPAVKSEGLANRVDIFIEDGAFNPEISWTFLTRAREMGFSITVHADQFTPGGSKVAAEVGAVSADHLEVTQDDDLEILKLNNIIATVLPGASIGLGLDFAPARKILDAGLTLVIASDWNPGSAPMGDLLVQASILGACEKLTISETLSAITNRAAVALELHDRGVLKTGYIADMIAFECVNYREIFYNQGTLKPCLVWKSGTLVK